jgi:type II secretory pathway pseudopilin PulG
MLRSIPSQFSRAVRLRAGSSRHWAFSIRHSSFTPAFTIVELMVVIAIIVALLAIIIPSMHVVRRNAANAATSATLGAIRMGLTQYFAQFNMYPPSAGGGDHMLAVGLQGSTGKGFSLTPNAAAMGKGTVYGPYGPTDPKAYNGTAFIDAFNNEPPNTIHYYRSTRSGKPDPALPAVTKVFGTGNPPNYYFDHKDCTGDPTSAPARFFSQIGTSDNNASGPVNGSSSYLLISAGYDGVFFNADDIVATK